MPNRFALQDRKCVSEVSGLFVISAKFNRWCLEALPFPLIFIACSIPRVTIASSIGLYGHWAAIGFE
ncbi:hypothetical protein MLD38_035826 [Melastoma candidum]|uniref:Uncharacterized protein n=1 Tax=Melastoma candidum TaxID=119954 RepID=A0ACB9LJN4_9MYRT|nr:hypothetical protein MLD38_035826 [Melastoma candidum]